jgi:hypothetical protein
MDDMVTWTLCVDDTWFFFMPKNVHPIYGLPPQKYNVHSWKYKFGFLLLVFEGQVFAKWSPKKGLTNPTKDSFGKNSKNSLDFEANEDKTSLNLAKIFKTTNIS